MSVFFRLILLPGLLVGLLCFLFAESANAQDHAKSNSELPVDQLTRDIDQAVSDVMEQYDIPGAGVVVVHGGKTIYKSGVGLANVEEGDLVDPDKTLFRIGSISKALTLLTLTRQVDLGRLEMDADVSQFIDGITNPYDFKDPVTIENLLTHTSGFDQIGGSDRQVRNFDQSLQQRKSARPNLSDYLTEHLRRVSPAGAFYRYDTYGSSLAGVVLEKVTGKDYPAAMRSELFEPLGMNDSFVEADGAHLKDLAIGYERRAGHNVAQPYEVYVTTPASSIDSTVADMGRLLEALTNGGKNEFGKLFTAEMASAVLAPQFRPHPEFLGTTHGLHESLESSGAFEKSVRTVDHGGTMQGFKSQMAIIPSHNVGVFVVANSSGGGRNPLAAAVMNSVVKNLPNVPDRQLYAVPDRDRALDLGEYIGDYYYGVFCHNASAEEFANGVWQRGDARSVTEFEGALLISDDEYVPRGDDVFVRSDGQRMVFFGRDKENRITHYVFLSSADTFEREHPDRPFSNIRSLAQSMMDIAEDSGIETAIKHFHKEKDSGEFYLREEEVNNLGYAWMEADRMEWAMRIFELNVGCFPESWNAHDSLGEACAKVGEMDRAIECYEKSLQLNPDNTAGAEVIRKLKQQRKDQ